MIKCENSINFHFKNDEVTYSLEELIEHFQNIFESNFSTIQSGEMVYMDMKVVHLLAYFDKSRPVTGVAPESQFIINAAILPTAAGVLDKIVLTIGAAMDVWVYNSLFNKPGNLIIHDWNSTLIAIDIRQRSKDISTYLSVSMAKNMINEVQVSPAAFFPNCDTSIVLSNTAHKSLKELAVSVARLSAVMPHVLIRDVERISAVNIWATYAGQTIKVIDTLLKEANHKNLWSIDAYSEEGSGIKRAFRNLIKYQEDPQSIRDLSAREFNEIANVQVTMGILGVELLNFLDQDFYYDPNKKIIPATPLNSVQEFEKAVENTPKPVYS